MHIAVAVISITFRPRAITYPSELKITDIRFTDIVGAPMHCTLMKIYTNQERMLLYRELDNLANSHRLDADLEAYRSRLRDRFGEIPDVAEELIRVVPLRAAGKQLGIEKIMLKQQKMFLYFVTNADSPYYQSEAFGCVLNYVSHHPRQCNFREVNGKRSIVISDVASVASALTICRAILTS